MPNIGDLADLMFGAAGLVPVAVDVPGDSSTAHIDAKLAKAQGRDDRVSVRVTVVGELWTAVAADQLRAVGHLLAHGDTVHGLFPLARAVLEHSAALFWVLDPHVEPTVRWARAALLDVDAVFRDAEIASGFYPKDHVARQARRETKRSLREGLEEDFPVPAGVDPSTFLHLTSPTFLVAGESIPGTSKMIGLLDSKSRRWQSLYGYLCLGTHPSVASIRTVSGSSRGGFEMTFDEISKVLGGVLAVYLHSLRQFAIWSGADLAPIDEFSKIAEGVFGTDGSGEPPGSGDEHT